MIFQVCHKNITLSKHFTNTEMHGKVLKTWKKEFNKLFMEIFSLKHHQLIFSPQIIHKFSITFKMSFYFIFCDKKYGILFNEFCVLPDIYLDFEDYVYDIILLIQDLVHLRHFFYDIFVLQKCTQNSYYF